MIRNQLLAGGIALFRGSFSCDRIPSPRSGRRRPAERVQRRPLFQFRGQIGDNPMYWKELYAESGSWRLGTLGFLLLALIFIVVCGTTICSLHILGQPSTQNGESYCYYAIGMSTFLCCCGLLLLIARAAGSITSKRERDCWTSLISTAVRIWRDRSRPRFWAASGRCAGSRCWSWSGCPAILLRPSYILGIAFSLLDLAILAAFAAALGIYCSQTAATTLRARGAGTGNRRSLRRLSRRAAAGCSCRSPGVSAGRARHRQSDDRLDDRLFV